MPLIGIQKSLIENNVINSLVIARSNDEADCQVTLIRHSTCVELKGNTLIDSESHTRSDAASRSSLLGLGTTKELTLDGQKLADAPQCSKPPR